MSRTILQDASLQDITAQFSTCLLHETTILLIHSNALLVDCTLRQAGHVGGMGQYDFSPLGVNFHFYANYVSKFSFVFTTNMAGNAIHLLNRKVIFILQFDDSLHFVLSIKY